MQNDKCAWNLGFEYRIDRTNESHMVSVMGVIKPIFDFDELEFILSEIQDCPDCDKAIMDIKTQDD